MDSQLPQSDPASGPVDGIHDPSGLCASGSGPDVQELGQAPSGPDADNQGPHAGTVSLKGIFSLANGFVQYLPSQMKANGKWSIPMYAFINKNCSRGILLFGSQTTRLINELPAAYRAMSTAPEKEYTFVVAENKVQKITLEVRLYEGKTYLFLKKYYNEKEWSKRMAAEELASTKKQTAPEASDPLDPPVWLPSSVGFCWC